MKANETMFGEKAGLYTEEQKIMVTNYLETIDLEDYWEDDMRKYNTTRISEDVIDILDIPEDQEEDFYYIVEDYLSYIGITAH